MSGGGQVSRLNERHLTPAARPKRRMHVLEEFPEPRLEAVVVQWDICRPTVLVQLLRDPAEPVQVRGVRPSALDLPLLDFVDAATGRIFGREAYDADIVFSQRAFSL